MHTIRCLIAENRHSMILTDILRRIVEKNPDITVVSRTENIDQLYDEVIQNNIDIVMLEVTEDTIPDNCKTILGQKPGLIVAGLIKDGRQAAIYIDDIGVAELASLMTMLIDDKRKRN